LGTPTDEFEAAALKFQVVLECHSATTITTWKGIFIK
jgi:hypothetical protein